MSPGYPAVHEVLLGISCERDTTGKAEALRDEQPSPSLHSMASISTRKVVNILTHNQCRHCRWNARVQ